MSGSRRGLGRALPLLLLALLLAGGAVGVWWKSTEVDRNLRAASGSFIGPEVLEVLARHGGDPRVQTRFRERLEELVLRPDYPATRLAPPIEMAYFDRVFTDFPPQADRSLLRAIAVAWFKWGHSPARAWAPGFDDHPEATAALLWSLGDMAASPNGWGDEPEEIRLCFNELLDELERRGVPEDDRVLRRAMVSLAIRYDFPRARRRTAAYGSEPWVAQAVADHLVRIAGYDEYYEGEGEIDRLMAELTRRRPRPTEGLRRALERYPALPSAVAAARALGLEAGQPAAGTDAGAVARDIIASVARRADPGELDPGSMPVAPLPSIDLPVTAAASGVEWGPVRPEEVRRAVDRLVQLGPAAVPALSDSFRSEGQRLRVHLAARALARIDPAALSALVWQALEDYEPLARERQSLEGLIRPEGFDAERYLRHGAAVVEGLGALERAGGSEEVDPAFLLALSCPDPAVAGSATRVLGALPTESYVPALFTYLGVKIRFASSEVDRYVESLTSREEATPLIVRALEGLLEAHGGQPDSVPWIHKVVAMYALQEVGDSRALPVLETYATDGGGYLYQDLKIDPQTQMPIPELTVEEERTFADLARATIERVGARRR